MITNEYFDQLTEQIRLSYAHLLKMHIQYCIKYKHFKNKICDDEMKIDFQQIEQIFFNENNKINWASIRPLMPPKIEGKIKKEFNKLNINEIRLCCLILFNVHSKNIAEILPYTQKSVHSMTHRIKRKTGIKKIKEGFKKFMLNDIIENTQH